ncbi:MAG: 3-deoxy-7-phosphoheptulonate synthase [Candidatus Dormibacterales bacterium]
MIVTQPARTRTVAVGSMHVGGGRPVLIAGPCSVEPGYPEHAAAIAEAGADALRAGVFKPRTRPDSFRGLGGQALGLLDEARSVSGLPLVSEVLSPADAEALAGHVDAFQVGARNMHNASLLEALGEIGLPVLLKRGMAATIDEWVSASEYVRRRGNDGVVLCERGIRTFETRTRNTLDVSAVVVARELTDLPIIVDPSHAAGNRAWVPALCRAALAAGADGLLVEAHPEPQKAWSDGPQAIDLEACRAVAEEVRARAAELPLGDLSGIEEGRRLIDAIDRRLIDLMAARREASRRVQELRLGNGGAPRDEGREAAIEDRYRAVLGAAGGRLASTLLDACRARPG